MNYGLTDEQLAMIIHYLEKFPVIEKAFIFGSRALGTCKPSSDIDIALIGTHVTSSLASHVKFYLEEETNLPYFCDIVAFNDIDNMALKNHIEHCGKLIYTVGPTC